MLETVRQHSRSAVIYILFGILIAAFVVSFGPGSPTGESSISIGGRYAAKVYGNEISEQDYHFAFIALGAGNMQDQAGRLQKVRELIMDRMIERELFAHEAEQIGLRVSDEEAVNLVAGCKMYVAGMLRALEPYGCPKGVLDYDKHRMVVQNSYRLTVKQFMEIQQREILADKLRQLMRGATRASLSEVRADFEDKNRQINVEYVRFSPYRYEAELAPSENDIENYARAHEDQIKKTYEERKALYTKQEKTVHARRILIELKKDATEAQINEARGKLEQAKKTLDSGTRFADVARTYSEDQNTKLRGGDLGFRRKGGTDLGAALEEKVFAAKPGTLVGPERSERGFDLIKVEDFREGDISLGQVRSELAEELYRADKVKELAQKAAQEAADKLKAGGKLAELFPKNDSDSAAAQAKATLLQTEETGLFSRRGDAVQGIGASDALSKALWKLKPGEWVGPIQVGDTFVVAALKERKEPDAAEFDKKKDELLENYTRSKWANLQTDWAKNACTAANSAGKLRVNLEFLEGEKASPARLLTGRYEPCHERQF